MTGAAHAAVEDGAIQARLAALSREQPALAGACQYYGVLLPRLKKAREGLPQFHIDGERGQQKLERGQPLLIEENLPFLPSAAQTLFLAICDAIQSVAGPEDPHLSSHSGFQGRGLVRIRQAAEGSAFQLGPLLYAAMRGNTQPLETVSCELELDAPLLRVIVQNCLRSFLYAWASQDEPEPRAPIDLSIWQKGICPFCGNRPILAELRGPQRARYLRCGLCGADWPFARLQCAFCYNGDTRSLGWLRLERDPERTLVQTCDACCRYLKTIVAFEPIPADLLTVEDLATVSLDWVAARRGYG